MSIGIAYNPCKNCKEMDKCSICELTYYRKGYIKSPTADVVEVVRCKDCEYWDERCSDRIIATRLGYCEKPLGDYIYSDITTAENDFCSYGERREK